jgi:hypothetical protein
MLSLIRTIIYMDLYSLALLRKKGTHSFRRMILYFLYEWMELQKEIYGRYGLRSLALVKELRRPPRTLSFSMIHVIQHELFIICHSEQDGLNSGWIATTIFLNMSTNLRLKTMWVGVFTDPFVVSLEYPHHQRVIVFAVVVHVIHAPPRFTDEGGMLG